VAQATVPTRGAAFRYGLRLGCISFGGPAGQIAILYRELVEERGWIGAADFARALNFCMLLPGPEALQLVIYLGWRWHGRVGGIVAGLTFLVPGALLVAALAWAYLAVGALAPVAALLTGLKAVVVALVAEALLRIARRALTGRVSIALALAAFLALAFAGLPFPLVILTAACAGLLGLPRPAAVPVAARTGLWRGTLAVLAVGALLWLLPLAILGVASPDPFPATLYRFLGGAALAGFGGAYAVLAYVGGELVHVHRWLSEADFLGGLALGETTPGPLMLVLEFLGFVAGWRHPGTAGALAGALLGAALASWAAFLPSFVLVLAGAPHVERLAGNPRVGAAFAGVTAAVVGVIANFALEVARAVLWPAGAGQPALVPAAIALAAFALLCRGVGLGWVLAAGALAGAGAALAGIG